MKNWLLFFVCVTTFLITTQWPDHYVHIIFCDVGQGDATLITYGFKQLLVDAGPNETGVLECLREHMPFWDRQLEIVVATHPDSDHIGGLPPILEQYRIGTIMETSAEKETKLFVQYKSAIMQEKQQGTEIVRPSLITKVIFDEFMPITAFTLDQNSPLVETEKKTNTEDGLWDVRVPKSQKSRVDMDINDLSIALFIDIDQVEVLLPGDLESKGETALVESGVLQEVDIGKVAHHGSKTSSTRVLLDVIQPENVVISSGKNNRYGHPSPEVIDRFVEYGATIWRTDTQGTIEFVTDGQTYWVK